MVNKFSKRGFIAGLLSTVAVGSDAGAVERSVRPRLRKTAVPEQTAKNLAAIVDAGNVSGEFGCVVADANSGELLEAHYADTALPPASVAKVVTAIYAISQLGAAFRFSTRVLASGPIQNGVLNGDLILVGNGDPVLDTDHLAGLVSELKKTGLLSIKGRFIVDATALPVTPEIDPKQPAHVAYNPGISGLNLNHNRVYFGWAKTARGYRIDLEARAIRYRPEIQMVRMQIKDRKSPVYTYRDGGIWDEWTVARSALSREGARWLPVRKPHRYVGEVFQTLASIEGLDLPDAEFIVKVPSGIVLVSHESPPLVDILQRMLKYSTNLTAEVVGMTATRVRLGKPVSLGASAAHMSRWANQRYGVRRVKLVDHSGLSARSRISAGAMGAILVKASGEKLLPRILKEIKMRKSNNNLAAQAPTKLKAKTGTLNFVSGLAGYVRSAGDRSLAFAIFAADTDRRKKIPQHDRERPKGARQWNRRAKILQYKLVNRWSQHFRS